MNKAAAGLIILLTGGCFYHLFSLFSVSRFFSGKKKTSPRSSFPPVSVLKPLKGTDPGIRENLESFGRQNYPRYEVVAGFLEPAAGAGEQMAPALDAGVRVVVSNRELGANRKVSNLQGLAEAAAYPLLAISDSDMRVEPSYLREIVEEYFSEENVGLVTCMYKISDPRSLGAALESLTIALDFMPSVLVARRLEGVTFGLGASLLLSKTALAQIGGFPAIADYLADDYQIGNRLWKKGYKIILSRTVIENVVGNMSLRDYLMHQLRWARTYRASRPKGFAGYGITHIVPLSLALFLVRGPDILSWSLLAVVLFLRFGEAAVVYGRVIRSKRWLRWVVLTPVKDIISFGIWCSSFFNSTVTWRGRSYRILKEGRMTEVA